MERHLAAERAADRQADIEAIAALSDALRARDEYTREHCEHVASLAAGIARELGLSDHPVDVVGLSCVLHQTIGTA